MQKTLATLFLASAALTLAGGCDGGPPHPIPRDGGTRGDAAPDSGTPSCCTAYDPADEASCASLSPADCEAKSECHPVLSEACGTCCTANDPAAAASCAALPYERCISTRPCIVATGAACMPEPSCCKGIEPRFDSTCDGLAEPECTRLDQCHLVTGAACMPEPTGCCIPIPGMGATPSSCQMAGMYGRARCEAVGGGGHCQWTGAAGCGR